MATAKQTTKQKGLDWRRHRNAADTLKRNHRDGTICPWCGRPMYRDRTRNFDYDPASTSSHSGSLHADHSKMSRSEALRRGLPIPQPDRLLHGLCNIQRGEGHNDHLAAAHAHPPGLRTNSRLTHNDLGAPTMDWPW
jgi:hypothetical protein